MRISADPDPHHCIYLTIEVGLCFTFTPTPPYPRAAGIDWNKRTGREEVRV